MSNQFDTVLKLIKLHKGLTNKDIAQFLGMTEQKIKNMRYGSQKFNTDIINKLKFEFLSDYKPLKEIIEPSENYKEIPVGNNPVFATISPAMSDAITFDQNTFIRIPFFSKGEYAVRVSGNSMKGYINAGDYIVIKRIVNKDFLIYGECYLVVTKSDNYKTVGFLNEDTANKNNLYISKYNKDQFSGQPIPKNEILEIYQVIGRFNKF